jgi:hypothetical protein
MNIPAPLDLKNPPDAKDQLQDTEAPLNTTKSKDQSPEIDGAPIHELILSKKYALPIKEKRYRPLLTFALLPEKSKQPKQLKPTYRAQSSKKEPATQATTMRTYVSLGLLAVLILGTFIAIDAQFIDVGWTPPFSIFGD